MPVRCRIDRDAASRLPTGSPSELWRVCALERARVPESEADGVGMPILPIVLDLARDRIVIIHLEGNAGRKLRRQLVVT